MSLPVSVYQLAKESKSDAGFIGIQIANLGKLIQWKPV